MKIVLINPPVRDFYNTPIRRQPLGLLYLASALKAHGHEVKLIDCGASKKKQRLPIPKAMKLLTPDTDLLDSSPFKLFGRYAHFGPSYQWIEEQVRAFEPDLAGVSSLFSAYCEEASACAQAVKKARPSCATVLGGNHASSLPLLALEDPHVDFVITGEGEQSLPLLADALNRGEGLSSVPGLVQSGSSALIPPRFQKDIEAFHPPARELLDFGFYRFMGKPMTQILSSRGCPHRCSFCSAFLTSGRVFRPRDPERVVDEMEACHNRFNVEVFDFEDDNLTYDRDRALHLMELIIKRFGPKKIRLEAMNGVSMRGLDATLLKSMLKAGFVNLNLSPLTAFQETRSTMTRPEAQAEALTVPRMAARMGFHVTAYIMVGYPGQTLEAILDTISLLAKEPVLLAASPFYPVPGARVQREAFPHLVRAQNQDWALMRSSLFPKSAGGLSRKELRTLFWLCRLFNFLKASPAQTVHATASTALDAQARGFLAFQAFIKNKHPQGVRLVRRGDKNRQWEYETFPLEQMIEDPTFYGHIQLPAF